MAHVHTHNLSKRFGAVVAVDDVSLTIPDGEMTVLLGPSGCGKTTLMRLIAGLEEATSGDIDFDGQSVTHVPVWDRQVAMVFQNYALYPHMSVFDNMAFPLRGAGMPLDEVQRRVNEASKRLDIHHLLRRKPRQLSGGQQQRVALGRAIVRQPRIFLMDEPLSNLDAALRVETRTEIKRLQRELGITTLYVTHDQIEAMTLADTLVIMREGRIEQRGTPQMIYDTPATVFVARFLGSPAMNIIPATVENGIICHQGVKLVPATNVPAAPLLLGFRPESITLNTPTDGGFAARIAVIEPTGKEQIITLQTKTGYELKAMTTARSFSVGDDVTVQVQADAYHLFERESQRRITE